MKEVNFMIDTQLPLIPEINDQNSPLPAPCWISLLEYALIKKISVSTLRRHIKAKKLTYKIENGRYLILDQETSLDSSSLPTPPKKLETLQNSVTQLETQLKQAKEEIAELKTLIAFYEETSFQKELHN